MKTTILICITIAFNAIINTSCDKEDGRSDPPIFDKNIYAFDNKRIDTILTAKNDVKWFFENLYINNSPLSFDSIEYYTKEIPKNADNILGYIYLFKNEWFSVEKMSNNKIKVTLEKNNTLADRELKFNASVGNAATTISFFQKK